MKIRLFRGLNRAVMALLMTVVVPNMVNAAPPHEKKIKSGNGLSSVANAQNTSDAPSYFLSSRSKVKDVSNGRSTTKDISSRAKARSVKNKTVKRFRFPDKIAEKFPGLPQEWIVEGYPATQAEYSAERVKLAGKKKHAKRARIKDKNSPVDRKLKKDKKNKNKNKTNQSN